MAERVARRSCDNLVGSGIVDAEVFAVEQVVPDFFAALADWGLPGRVEPFFGAVFQGIIRPEIEAVAEAFFDADLPGNGKPEEMGAQVFVRPAADAAAVGQVEGGQLGIEFFAVVERGDVEEVAEVVRADFEGFHGVRPVGKFLFSGSLLRERAT